MSAVVGVFTDNDFMRLNNIDGSEFVGENVNKGRKKLGKDQKDIYMTKMILLFVLIVASVGAFSQTQSKMNSDAGDSLHAADKELNDVYKMILGDYRSDTVFIKNLKISQRLWIEFRNAEMNMKYPERKAGYYGSVLPMCWAIYEEQLTIARTKTLRQWIDGIEEADVCAGPVKRKQ